MDLDQAPSTARKVRYIPKGPPRRRQKLAKPKTEEVDEGADDAANGVEAAQLLLRRVNEHLGRQGPKVEKKSSVQVAFAHGSASSTSIRTYGIPGEGNSSKSNGLGLKDSAGSDNRTLLSLPSTAELETRSGSSVTVGETSHQKAKKNYREPWDYHHTNYPTTLPLRRPYSGDPELLDEAEFGDAAMNSEFDENAMNPALELGLLEENDKPQMLFLQLPANLPLFKRSANMEGKERTSSLKPSGSNMSTKSKGKAAAGGSTPLGETGASAAAKWKEMVGYSMPMMMGNASKWGSSVEELPGGFMGKMLVYKSGAIKWKLGEVVYDVSPGLSCICAQDVAAMNTVDKNCCVLGEVNKRAIVTPDIDSLLNNVTALK